MSLLEMYDEEFNRYLDLAKVLIAQLRTREDRAVCTKWIRKMFSLKTRDVSIKKNRNAFFKYMLQILHQGVLMDSPDDSLQIGAEFLEKKDQGFISRWSLDKRTYVAAKPIPGKGALVYMAVAKDETLGWDIPQKRNKPNSSSCI